MAEFHFLRPFWLLAFIPLALFLRWLAGRGRAGGAWETVCEPALLPYILAASGGRPGKTPLVLLALAATLAIIALAGPTWERLPRPALQKQAALVIGLDLSYSMYARDIQPSRWQQARFKIADLLDLRKEGQTALLVYAGAAFTVSPLTNDSNTIKAQLTALSPAIMPAPGSNAGSAIDMAMKLLAQAGHRAGHILLVTDEVRPDDEARFLAAREKNYPVSILAVGAEAGAPIKMEDGSLLEDRAGDIVIPKLNPAELRRLARAGGGRYEQSRITDADLRRLNALFNRAPGLGQGQATATDQWADQWHEFGAGLILFILPLAALAFRRGYIGVLACLILIRPDPAMAFDWRDLWLNKDQQAMRALDNKQPAAAAELFRDKDWRAVAEYRAGRYAAAAELLQDKTDERGMYNKGNALARQGHYQQAIAAYADVLQKNPDHADAGYNKALLEALLEQQNAARQEPDDGRQSAPGEAPERQETPAAGAERQARPGQDRPEQGQAEQNTEDMAKAERQDADRQPDPQAGQQPADTPPASQEQQAERQQATDTARQDGPESAPPDEAQLAAEQWLRRIPDDPGGLLRRKFQYQYQQQDKQPDDGQYW